MWELGKKQERFVSTNAHRMWYKRSRFARLRNKPEQEKRTQKRRTVLFSATCALEDGVFKMHFVLNILFFAVSVFLVANLMPTIRIKSFGTAVAVSLVYSLVNFPVGWLITFLALPFILIMFGLFIFVVNAILLWLTDKLIENFEIEGFGTTLIASLLISMINSFLKWLF